MSDKDNSIVAQNAARAAEWLMGQGAEFEGQGVSEESLASALGLTHDEITEAIDHLENREEVVRFPRPSTTPPQVILKPGRGWPEIREKMLGSRPQG
jgi:hypothetical protein